MSREKSMDRLGPVIVLMIPSPLVRTSADAIWKSLGTLPAKFRKCFSSSPTSTNRLTVKCGAQNEGKERMVSLPGQYTGLKAKRGTVIADAKPGEEG